MNNRSSPSSPPIRRLAITVCGVVQGVGFRPFVYNAARRRRLTGWVLNDAGMVRIEVQGERGDVEKFLDDLRDRHPPQARIDSFDAQDTAVQEGGDAHGRATAIFEIRTSEGHSAPRPTIPADLATCRDCLDEISDPSQRRYRYPFTNCTNCGPRWSIIEELPYDRPRTSMAGFEMCPECRAEYENPADRRFHAQPIACPRCGPRLQLLSAAGHDIASSETALDTAAKMLIEGRILAMKGLGGFQLLVDACNAEAVARLRQRKRRADRPFAVMVPLLADAQRYCEMSEPEAELLSSHQAPIVLLRRHAAVSDASPSSIHCPQPTIHTFPAPVDGVAPGNPYLGIMLPYTPLHHLLLAAVARPVVCTSGNLAEEPMAITIEDALDRLGSIADAILTHDRPIVRPVDDSIVRIGSDGPQVLRHARGFAPLPIELSVADSNSKAILAVGGHLENTVALALSRVRETHQLFRTSGVTSTQVVMSAHVGDLDSVLSVGVFRRAIDDLISFFEVEPSMIVCDLHPDYASTQHAEQLAARWNVPLLHVQHHHAHVAACMAEHGLQGPVLGFSWDGTGYGPDGTVWGGEVLLCQGAEYRRMAHLRTFALPGGDRAVREPRRSALGLLFELFGDEAAELADEWFTEKGLQPLLSMLRRGLHSPRTSSMGRLFDGVAALCGLPPVISFEGQAAMALEYAADEKERSAYPMLIEDSTQNGPFVLDWRPLVRAVLADHATGLPVSRISARFHNALAETAAAVARRLFPEEKPPIVLTGGCFQNALLTARVRDRLSRAGFQVYTHRMVPPGDGGIALGQVFLALQQR